VRATPLPVKKSQKDAPPSLLPRSRLMWEPSIGQEKPQ